MPTPAAATAKLSRLSDADLIAERRKFDARDDLAPEERMVAAWVADELHRRYPATEAIIDGYFAADDDLATPYADLLERAIAEAQR